LERDRTLSDTLQCKIILASYETIFTDLYGRMKSAPRTSRSDFGDDPVQDSDTRFPNPNWIENVLDELLSEIFGRWARRNWNDY